jgi:hypothetical protein
MYCETERELELLGKLQRQFPESNSYLLELVSWVYLNKPDDFARIMAEHEAAGGEPLVDITQLNVLMPPIEATDK